MKALYRLAVSYFALMGLLLLLSGAALALLKGGLTPHSILEYYAPKSAAGLLKTAQPHFLGIGIFLMVTLHFFLFLPNRPSVLHVSLLYLLGIVMITLPFGIDEAAWFPALLKLLATLLFIILTSRLLLRLFSGARHRS